MNKAHNSCKAVEQSAVTDSQLEQINRYTRRAMTREEVFVFSVVLCDNEIDRDGERFPTESLTALGELFQGKTGVFDHNPRAENQSARIFDTTVEQTGEVNSLGEDYVRLRAFAYMVRCDKNDDLILEIDAGIKKEVSVGCAVEQVLCSVCGQDQKAGGCSHEKGKVYDSQLCHHLLVGPSDAYEWSFVAVPAQKKAGVIKRLGGDPGDVVVTKARLDQLEQLAVAGLRYQNELQQSVVKLGRMGLPDLAPDSLTAIAARLDIAQLEALKKSLATAAGQRYPLPPQLGRVQEPVQENTDREFRI